MSLHQALLLDRKLTSHLALKGTVDDPIGDRLVNEIVATALKHPVIAKHSRDQQITQSALVAGYKGAIRHLFPSLLIRVGPNVILAPSLMLVDTHRFPAYAHLLTSRIKIGFFEGTPEQAIASQYCLIAEDARKLAEQEGSAVELPSQSQLANLPIPRAGCAGVLFLALLFGLGSALSAALLFSN